MGNRQGASALLVIGALLAGCGVRSAESSLASERSGDSSVSPPVVGGPFGVTPLRLPGSPGVAETAHVAASNADGTVLVVWIVNYGVAADVYGARIDVDGTVLDPGGIVLSAAPYEQSSPAVASNGSEWLVVWQDSSFTQQHSIRGTRVAADGSVLDPDGLTVANTSIPPAVASDGVGFVVGWTGGNVIDGDRGYHHVIATRVNANGEVLGSVSVGMAGWPPSLSDIDPYPISVAYDGNSWLFVYRHLPNGSVTSEFGLLGSLADPTLSNYVEFHPGQSAGTDVHPTVRCATGPCCMVWETPSGIFGAVIQNTTQLAVFPLASSSEGPVSFPSVSWDGTNFVAAWRAGIEAQPSSPQVARIAPTGVVLDTSPVSVLAPSVSVAVAGSGGRTLVVAGDPPWNGGATRAGYLSDEGAFGEDIVVSPSTSAISTAPAVAASDDQYLAVWRDSRDADPNDLLYSVSAIYATRVSRAGAVLDPQGLVLDGSKTAKSEPEVAWNGTDWLAVWSRLNEAGDSDVYARRVGAGGQLEDEGATLIAGTPDSERFVHVASDGSRWLVTWGLDADRAPRVARVDAGGKLLDPDGIRVALGSTTYSGAPAVAGGHGQWLLADVDYVDTGFTEVRVQRVADNGSVLDEEPIFLGSTPDGIVYSVDVAYGDGQWLVVWVSVANEGSFTVKGARVDDAGHPLDSTPFDISLVGTSALPAVGYDGSNWLVTWSQPPNASHGYGISGTRVSPSGMVLDPDGFSIAGGSGERLNGAATGRAGQWLVAYDVSDGPVNGVMANLIHSVCVASAAADVTCDGVDDDCDGSVDEDAIPGENGCPPLGTGGQGGVSSGGVGGVAGGGVAGTTGVGGAAGIAAGGEGGTSGVAGGGGITVAGADSGGATAGGVSTGGIATGGGAGAAPHAGEGNTAGQGEGATAGAEEEGGSAGAAAAGRAGSNAAGSAGTAPPADNEGCGCSVPKSKDPRPASAGLALLVFVGMMRLRRSRRGQLCDAIAARPCVIQRQ